MANGQSFSGSTKYYNSGAYESPTNRGEVQLIRQQGAIWANTIDDIGQITKNLVDTERRRIDQKTLEAEKLLSWSINEAMKNKDQVYDNLAKLGVNNETYKGVADQALKEKSYTETQLQRGKYSKEERQELMKRRDKAAKTLSQLIPAMEARENMMTDIQLEIEEGKANTLGGMDLSENNWAHAAYIASGWGGNDSREIFSIGEDGSIQVTYSGGGVDTTNQDALRLYNSAPQVIPDINKNILRIAEQSQVTDKQGNLKDAYYIMQKDANGNNVVDPDTGLPQKKVFYKVQNGQRIAYYKADMARAARALAPQLGSQSATLLNTEGGAQSINRYLGNDEDLTAGYNAKRELYGLYEENDAVAFRDAYSKYANTLLQGKEIIVSKNPIEKRNPPTSAQIKEGKRKDFVNNFYTSIKENLSLFGLGQRTEGDIIEGVEYKGDNVFTGIIDVNDPQFKKDLQSLNLQVIDELGPEDGEVNEFIVQANGMDKVQKFSITQGMPAQQFIQAALLSIDATYDEAKSLAFLGDLNPEYEKAVAGNIDARALINKFLNKK